MPPSPSKPTTTPPVADSLGPVPPDNQPGHHPEVEQDKPTGAFPGPPEARVERFDFAFDPWFRLPALALGVTPMSAVVKVTPDQLRIRFGRWHMAVDRDEIEDVTASGPFMPWKVIGPPRLSLKDRGITFATNRDRGVCIKLRNPVPGIEPTGRIRHPGITVTVADVDGLIEALAV